MPHQKEKKKRTKPDSVSNLQKKRVQTLENQLTQGSKGRGDDGEGAIRLRKNRERELRGEKMEMDAFFCLWCLFVSAVDVVCVGIIEMLCMRDEQNW
jgi:hypothetical protein